MKTRYVKTLENLSEHTRHLQPLSVGDSVFVQNQTGRFPNKWDRCGTIAEVRSNDQYAVKISGTGRLTVRNRRFLRKFTSHLTPVPLFPLDAKMNFVDEKPCSSTVTAPESTKISQSQPNETSGKSVNESELEHDHYDPVDANPPETATAGRKGARMLNNLLGYNNPGLKEGIMETDCEPSSPDTVRRSSRLRKPVRHYDAQSGD